MITIYHNPRCGKSRDCLAFLETSDKKFEIIKYLETPLSLNELKEIIRKLNINPIELIRKNETIWKENFKGKELTDSEIIQSMVDYPILIERPIVVYNDKAIIARPLEKINEII
ncbi:arsenate reductase (glutaredoxin) [Flavobacterium aquatile]|uniref:Arsenate reductase n=1 Tax=Flavobacterium aquatile LMG 4008 = ATCC 11947 TaxID=1453498 RepID=A0A095TZ69_9FLAO|nr:arsenate reductase (glutaredoxin) [Flavobacterium aquatile]KGD67658.1 arsenate reductase [Flavobacterium aquatile LMG 4008 = ATCC 11947]OXA67523.1 arsenate reductase (glutaredoxin) [Flavobacterium aquatile LMG 4008 = ATCC 11947]GEC79139.1 arsenate reductase [Flavobacterium aquatile]